MNYINILKKRKNAGLTLIETLTTITILSSVLGIATGFIIMVYQVHYYTWEQAIAINEARRGVETMVKEIRKASPGNDGSHIIEKADDFEFIFFADVDEDKDIERVRYFVIGTDFKKGVIDPIGWPITYPLANEQIHFLSQSIRNLPPIFRYFDNAGNELLAPARLKDTNLMRVKLVINVHPERLPDDFILESSAHIRNLRN